MDRRDLHRRCVEQVRRLEREVGIPRPFVLQEFITRFARWRGRRIELVPYDHLGGMCGLWLGFEGFDVIAYARASTLHEEHIVLHEVAHMLCDHHGAARVGDNLIRLVAPDLDPEMVHRVLGRASYPEGEEQEAELIATLILNRVADHRPDTRGSAPADLAPELDRLTTTFEG